MFSIAKGVQHDGRLPFWKPASVFAYYVCIVIACFRQNKYLPARRRPHGLVVIGVCLSVCLCDGQRAGLCPPRTQ